MSWMFCGPSPRVFVEEGGTDLNETYDDHENLADVLLAEKYAKKKRTPGFAEGSDASCLSTLPPQDVAIINVQAQRRRAQWLNDRMGRACETGSYLTLPWSSG